MPHHCGGAATGSPSHPLPAASAFARGAHGSRASRLPHASPAGGQNIRACRRPAPVPSATHTHTYTLQTGRPRPSPLTLSLPFRTPPHHLHRAPTAPLYPPALVCACFYKSEGGQHAICLPCRPSGGNERAACTAPVVFFQCVGPRIRTSVRGASETTGTPLIRTTSVQPRARGVCLRRLSPPQRHTASSGPLPAAAGTPSVAGRWFRVVVGGGRASVSGALRVCARRL